MSEVFIDASLFLGMHSRNESVRSACKAFFVRYLNDKIVMSLEQVGRCDDVVWSFGRELQDAYYPFMDNLHTDMRIDRRSYQESDLRTALRMPELANLPISDRLLVGMVAERSGTLYTVNPRLANRTDLPVVVPPRSEPKSFPQPLERLYQHSLALRIGLEVACQ
ncbi:MAG TPA: DUF6190 family protein [Micromonosporaceae bacterium]